MKPVETLSTIDLFPQLHAELLALLRGLSPEAWALPTACGDWSVKDVAAHLLHGDIRRLSGMRDGHHPPAAEHIASYDDLLAFINNSNQAWIAASQDISPQLLIQLMEIMGPQVDDLFAGLDPDAPGLGVAWAGEMESPNGFDIAREYTEKWHHQQHIREAVGAAGLVERKWLYPILDTFLRGWPHAYRVVVAPDGTRLTLEITEEAGGCWSLIREEERWKLYSGCGEGAAVEITCSADTAWRLFTKGLSPEEARRRITFTGDRQLGEPFIHLVSIMA